MEMLKASEWITINKILLELYCINDVNSLTEKVLKVFRMLIPYSKGYFLIYDEQDRVDVVASSFLGMDKKMFVKYIDSFYEKDYLNYVFELARETATYRDTDIMEESIRKKTEFYRDFLKPNNIPFGAGIALIKGSGVIGIINFFRNGELGDFSDKDMFIFDLLKQHLMNIVHRLKSNKMLSQKTDQEKTQDILKSYGLSNREKEVIMYILKGYSNVEISEKMLISLSTVKKHIYNIYLKTGVKTRMQLSALIIVR